MSPAPSLFAAIRPIALALAVAGGLAGSAFAAAVEPLVSPQWLKAHLTDSELVVLDIRSALDGGGAQAYAERPHPWRSAQRLRQGRLAGDA